MNDKFKMVFKGKVVNKAHTINTGVDEFPRYVLEYLIDNYCSEETFHEDMEKVVRRLKETFVYGAEAEKIRHYIRENRRHSVIANLEARLVETEDKYWGAISAINENFVNIPESIIRQYPMLLSGGMWGTIDLTYDETEIHNKKIRPFKIAGFTPFQVSVINLDEYVELSAFADVEIGVAASKTINDAMEQVMDKIGEIFSPEMHGFLLIDKKTEELYFKLVQGQNADRLKECKISKGEGLSGWIVDKGKPDFIENVKEDSRLSKNIDRLTGFDIKSTIGAPVIVIDKIIGVFQLVNKSSGEAYTAEDLNILTTIVEYAAMAIEKVYYLSAMKDLDNVDSLTGVYKRRHFDSQFSKEKTRAKRYTNALSMLIVNVDDFKTINDEHGHEAGDKILKSLADVLKKSVRRVDIVARYSGDEFVVLLPQTSKSNAELVRERIEKEISKQSKKSPVPYSVSIGLGSAGAKTAGTVKEKAEKDLQVLKKQRK